MANIILPQARRRKRYTYTLLSGVVSIGTFIGKLPPGMELCLLPAELIFEGIPSRSGVYRFTISGTLDSVEYDNTYTIKVRSFGSISYVFVKINNNK